MNDSPPERILASRGTVARSHLAGSRVLSLVSSECGAVAFSTSIVALDPRSKLPYHSHDFSKAITILDGAAHISVEGRRYQINRYDCIHLPSGTAYSIENACPETALLALYALGSSAAVPYVTFRTDDYPAQERGAESPRSTEPEFIRRFQSVEVYELAEGALFRDLFAKRFGAVGICGGYGSFRPGASLPCHFHRFDESITILTGRAVCLVEGRRYELEPGDTAFIPRGRVHRFLNCSNDEMAMLWVYAGTEPERVIVNSDHCSGKQSPANESVPIGH